MSEVFQMHTSKVYKYTLYYWPNLISVVKCSVELRKLWSSSLLCKNGFVNNLCNLILRYSKDIFLLLLNKLIRKIT